MTPKTALDRVVASLVGLDVHILGDDSPLENPWEEIKEQLQNGQSVYWPGYVDAMRRAVAEVLTGATEDDARELLEVLGTTSLPKAEKILYARVIARAKRQKIHYRPFDFGYFYYHLLDFTVYGCVIERTGLDECDALVYSPAAPYGERSTLHVSRIEGVLTRDQFEMAEDANWPHKS